MKKNIYIKYCEKFYRFVTVFFHANDASLMIHDKSFRINYHATGQVNYHGLGVECFYMPLAQLKDYQELIKFNICDLDKFEECVLNAEDVESEAVLEFNESKDIVLEIGLKDTLSPSTADQILSVLVEGIFEVCILQRPGQKGHNGVSRVAPKTKFAKIQIDIDKAFIAVHQKLVKSSTRSMIIYPPNLESVVRIIPIVPMRILPKITILFTVKDITYKVLEEQSRHYKIFISIRGKGGSKLTLLPPFESIEFDAEL